MNNFLFRVDANKDIGWGHLYRCIALSNYLKKLNKDSVFLIKYFTPQVIEYLDINNIKYVKLNESKILDFKRFLLNLKEKNNLDVAIIDINHTNYLNEEGALEEHIKNYKEQFLTVLFSELKNTNLDCDIVVMPYIELEILDNKLDNLLIGESYFILRDEFIKKGQDYNVRKPTQHIAITMGGGNPSNSIEKAIESVIKSNFKGTCNVIMGRSSVIDRERIDKQLKESEVIFNFIYNSNFSSELLNADIVFTNSGLTKYESLFLGVPTFAFSINATHSKMMDEFEIKTESLKHIGNINKLESSFIAHELNMFMSNYELRTTMSQNGKKIIDGNGSKRLVQKISEKYKKNVYEK